MLFHFVRYFVKSGIGDVTRAVGLPCINHRERTYVPLR